MAAENFENSFSENSGKTGKVLESASYEESVAGPSGQNGNRVLQENRVIKSAPKISIPSQIFQRNVVDGKKLILKNFMMSILRARKRNISPRKLDFLSEYFFHVVDWPVYALQIVFDPDSTYQRRLALASFFIGNGLLEAWIAENIYKIYNKHWSATVLWKDRFRQFRNLFDYLNKPFGDPDRNIIRMKYFYYDIQTNRTLYLNGQRKH